jgi:hypothetical protein
MPFRVLFFTGLLLVVASCSVDNDVVQARTTSAVFDTLQGEWFRNYTTYMRVNAGGPHYVWLDHDSIKFNANLTGVNHFPQAPVNFTYNLLPDDSTLIFNTGSVTNPVFDTVIITAITARSLNYRSKIKTITIPLKGDFYLYSVMTR